MPVELITIPLNSGVRQDMDPKLHPDGLFESLTNARLRKTGALGVRLGYTALGTATFGGGTLRAFDVVSHDDTLLVFGTENANAGGPEKVYALDDTTGQWVGEDTGSRPRSLSAVTELKQVFRPPYVQSDEEQLYDVAYANGHVCLVFEDHASLGNVVVCVCEPATGAMLFTTTVAGRTRPRVVGVGSVLVFAWVDSASDVRAATFTVGTSTSLSAETTLHTGTVGDGIDLAPVSGASEFVLAVVDSGTATLRRCDTALSVQATGTSTASDLSLISVVSTSGGLTHLASVDSGGNYELESFSTATLGSATGATALFGGSTGTRPPVLTVKSSGTLVIAASIPDTIDSQLKVDVRAESGHAASSQVTHREVSLQSKLMVSPDAQGVYAVSPYGQTGLISFTGILDVENAGAYECAHHRGFAVDALASWVGGTATDGTRHWAVFPVTDLHCSHAPVVMQFRLHSPERRSTAGLGGQLYIAGGAVGVWDGVRTVEAGFFDAPVIDSATPSAEGGDAAVPSSSVFTYAVAFDWYDSKGDRHLSPVSADVQVTTGASDDTVTLVVSTPHSMRTLGATACKVIVYRTRAAPDRTKRRTVFGFPTTFAATITLVDEASDSEILTQEVIYTQGARGTLSGPLQHEAPFPATYLDAGAKRIASAGLPLQTQGQKSKQVFPEEPIEWSGHPGHFIEVEGRTTAVISQDQSDIFATRDRLYVVGGIGPDDAGNGEFDPPRELPANRVGVIDHRSVVRTGEGTWFQAYPDRLYLLPRDGGTPQWLSQPARDTLAAFPVITGAAVCAQESTVAWACQNNGGTEGRLVSYDTRAGVWYVDTLDEMGGGPIRALCEHRGRLVAVVGTTVYRQDTTYPASTFLPWTARMLVAPAGVDGYARLKGFSTTGEHRGDSRLEAFVGYEDSGGDVATTVPQPVDLDGTAGETTELSWYPRRRKGNRFLLELRQTELSGASEGQLVSAVTLEVIRKRGTGRRPRVLR